jgi:hypothetical protein
MTLTTDIKVTTGILWQGALIFAFIDTIFIAVLARIIKPARLREMKWTLVAVMGVFFCALFGILASHLFWESVYHYVFPEWSRWFIPPAYGLLFAAVGLLFWGLAFRLPSNAVLNFCILGGLWGMVTHVWAIYRGILDKPPMLQGVSPTAAVVLPIFEFMFYWCICLSLASLLQRGWEWLRGSTKGSSRVMRV